MPEYGLPNKEVKDVMSKKVVYVRKNDTIEEAVEKFIETGFHGFPVVHEGDLVGVVTKLDLLLILERKGIKDVYATHVSDIMTPQPISVDPKTHLVEAAELLIKNKISLLPVVDEQKNLVGVLSRTDLVNEIAKSEKIDFE